MWYFYGFLFKFAKKLSILFASGAQGLRTVAFQIH